jgi:hypothetical protein
MTSERIKEIQQQTAYPDSISVQQALLQVWNECSQLLQQEISDEEIEKESWGYREVTKDMEIPPNEDWSNGAKWYREQLKLKKD